MLKNRRFLYIAVALIISCLTVLVTYQWLQGAVAHASASAAAKADANTVQVLVAREEVPAGTILRPEHVVWQAWPRDAVAAGYFRQPEATVQSVTGAVVRNALYAGEPLKAEGVVQPGERSFLSAVLRPGFRAVTINVSASTGVAGFILPGDKVDLILSRVVQGPNNAKRVPTETVIRDIRILGMDQRASNDKKVVIPQTATLEVTPEQAEIVAAASELGKLTLALRSLATAEEETAVASYEDRSWLQEEPVYAAAPPARTYYARPRASSPAPAAPVTVQVVRGGKSSSEG